MAMMIDKYLGTMLVDKASDLHLQEGLTPRYRIDGDMIPMPNQQPIPMMQMIALMQQICPPDKWTRFEATGDMDFAYQMEGGHRFRVNYNMNSNGSSAVLRSIPAVIPTLADLKAPEALREFANFQSGLCLVTGPTGSGKSTTLAALIDHINSTRRRMILTIEDPIEFVHTYKESTVVQREVGEDVDSFSEALRNAVRQDVQVILVGEMRDLETIELALTAAEMGMLVFGTLHTNSSIKTIDRIIDVFPAEQQGDVRESLANSLRAICSQRLVQRIDGAGRLAVHEILFQTQATASMIRECKTNQINQVIMSSRAMGMQLMDETLLTLVKHGKISGREAYRKANDKEPFKQYVGAVQ